MTGERGLKNPIQRTIFYLQRSSGARVMVGFMFFSGLIFVRSRLFVVFDFFLASFWALFWRLQALKRWQIAAAWKILSNELLFMSNGAQEPELRSVLCSQSFCFLQLTSEMSSEHVDRCLYQAMNDSLYIFWEITVCHFVFVFATRFFLKNLDSRIFK